MTIFEMKELCESGKIRWTNHVLLRLFQRGIAIDNVLAAIRNGEIIEEYPDDYPYPSCLVLGKSNNINLHIVCGVGDGELWIITAYKPDPEEWINGLKERRK